MPPEQKQMQGLTSKVHDTFNNNEITNSAGEGRGTALN